MSIDLVSNRTVIVDSLKNSSTFYDDACHRAYRLIQLIYGAEGKKEYFINQHKFYLVADAPAQTNGYDCGAFIIDFVQFKLHHDRSIFELHSNFKRYLMNRLLLENVEVPQATSRIDFSDLNVVYHSKRKIEYNRLRLDEL